MDKPKCCAECDMRIIDREHGDYCMLMGLHIMDNRFTYEAELNKIYTHRDVCCPIDREERRGSRVK